MFGSLTPLEAPGTRLLTWYEASNGVTNDEASYGNVIAVNSRKLSWPFITFHASRITYRNVNYFLKHALNVDFSVSSVSYHPHKDQLLLTATTNDWGYIEHWDLNRKTKLRRGPRQSDAIEQLDKAAYWDGKDSLGEKVASGVYFYTLQAGEFRATRKMVIVK